MMAIMEYVMSGITVLLQENSKVFGCVIAFKEKSFATYFNDSVIIVKKLI